MSEALIAKVLELTERVTNMENTMSSFLSDAKKAVHEIRRADKKAGTTIPNEAYAEAVAKSNVDKPKTPSKITPKHIKRERLKQKHGEYGTG